MPTIVLKTNDAQGKVKCQQCHVMETEKQAATCKTGENSQWRQQHCLHCSIAKHIGYRETTCKKKCKKMSGHEKMHHCDSHNS